MLAITDRAAKHLKEELSKAAAPCADRFRVFVRENCLEVVRDEQRPGDVAVSKNEEVLLVMDQQTADSLSDCTIDFDQLIARLVFT
jgi:Fe-S cluster assembly iron-binding protein IscA